MRRMLAPVVLLVAVIAAGLGYTHWRASRTNGELNLSGKRVAFLIADQFNPAEYTTPRKYLGDQGAEVFDVGLTKDKVKALRSSTEYPVSKSVGELTSRDIDCLVIPGGQCHRALIADERVARLIQDMCDAGKVVAANGRSPLVLGKAGVLRNKSVTVWSDVVVELKPLAAEVNENSGVVIDGNIVTSRGPSDAADFGLAIAKVLAGKGGQ